MKIKLQKYLNYFFLFFNVIYSTGETAARYFLKEINFEKNMIDKAVERNKNTIKYAVLFVFIDCLLLVQDKFSFKFIFALTFGTYLMGILYPFFTKYIWKK